MGVKDSCTVQDKCVKANLRIKLRTLHAVLDTLGTIVILVTLISIFWKMIAWPVIVIVWVQNLVVVPIPMVPVPVKLVIPEPSVINVMKDFIETKKATALVLNYKCIQEQNLIFVISECGCDATKGSQDVNCDATGKCTCKDTYTGLKCDMCQDNYYLDASGLCQST